jgi:hypothetical protein
MAPRDPIELTPIQCSRCEGSGEIGIRSSDCRAERPGPVPEDARGWTSATCPDCGGSGDIEEAA